MLGRSTRVSNVALRDFGCWGGIFRLIDCREPMPGALSRQLREFEVREGMR